MNEFMPTAGETRKAEKVQTKIDELEIIASIGARLIKEGLKDKDDEMDDHLVPQLHHIMESQNVLDVAIAENLVVAGYEIDTELANGAGIGETLIGAISVLTPFILQVLRDEFPKATKEQADLVVGRLIDKHKGGHIVDSLLQAIEERREIMRSLGSNNYIADPRTGLVQQKITQLKDQT